MNAPDRLSPLAASVLALISERLGVLPAAVLGRDRRAEIVYARHLAMWLLSHAGVAASEIGRQLNRDHSTVIHGRTKITKLMILDESVLDDVHAIAKLLGW